MENILFYEFIIEWYTHVIIVILHGANKSSTGDWRKKLKCHFSFVQRQIFKLLLRQSNPRIYKPTNLLILRKPRKLNPTKIKYFTVNEPAHSKYQWRKEMSLLKNRKWKENLLVMSWIAHCWLETVSFCFYGTSSLGCEVVWHVNLHKFERLFEMIFRYICQWEIIA